MVNFLGVVPASACLATLPSPMRMRNGPRLGGIFTYVTCFPETGPVSGEQVNVKSRAVCKTLFESRVYRYSLMFLAAPGE